MLFRNPLTFSYSMNFHYWIKFIFSGTDKNIETSTDKKDFINLDDIESSNNILLENTEYKNSVEILDNDLSFLQNNIKYNMNFKLNLFILNDEYNNNLYEVDQTDLSTVYPNINDNNKNNNDLEEIVRESLSFFPYDDFNYKKFNFHKKYFGSEDISLLEKLYLNELVNNRYIFKIYFTEIFSKRIIEENKEKKLKNNIDKNIEIINKSSFSINEEEEDDDEEGERQKVNIIIDNNSKYCELLKLKLVSKIYKGSINTFGDKD